MEALDENPVTDGVVAAVHSTTSVLATTRVGAGVAPAEYKGESESFRGRHPSPWVIHPRDSR